MAEATPVTVYDDFCTEREILQAAIAGYEASPDLATVDDLSAARVRLQIIQDAIPGLWEAKETYEAAERASAILAVRAPRWASAASTKSTLLGEITTLVTDLLAKVEAYNVAHGQQMACLLSLGQYSPALRANYMPMTSRLAQIVGACCHEDRGQHAWGKQALSTFDTLGTSATLPIEY
jgi:hypothetical protein